MEPLSILLICVFLQVGLTFWAIASMGLVRIESHKKKEVTFGDIALNSGAYPESVTPYTNNTNNQFQTPILLYTVAAISAATGAANWGVALGAVIFIAARFVHRWIHVGNNNIRKRFNTFLVSLSGLAIAWIALGISLLGFLG